MNVLNFQSAIEHDGNLKWMPLRDKLNYVIKQLNYEYDADRLTPEEFCELEEWAYENYEV